MKQTTNLGLKKSGYDDFGDVEILNENWDKVDEAITSASSLGKVNTKAAPADADSVIISDSADSGKTKRLLWSGVKTALNKLFVPLTRKVNGKRLNADVTLSASDVGAAASDHNHDTRYYTRDQIDIKMGSAVTTSNIMSKLGTVPISKGGTGVTRMTGSDYEVNRPRGIVIATSVPSSVSNGCLIVVAEDVETS